MTSDELAQEIRRVDGENSLGAGALADALMPFLTRTPAPEGEAVAWRCSGCGRLTDDLDADHAFLDAGGFLSCCPERDMKPLYASPVVPVGVSREEIARMIDPAAWAHWETVRVSWTVSDSLAKADAILAALRPTDTGANND